MATKLTFRALGDIRVFISTTGGLGLVKYAPGTVTSAVAVLVWWAWLSELRGFHQMGAILICGLIAYYCISATMREHSVGDDSAITIDEVVGQWVALIALPKNGWLVLAAFAGFRALDILKPDP